jgi:hypothetical protein
MSDAASAPWEWLFGGRYMGFTLTFTRGLTPDRPLERYGADPSAARPRRSQTSTPSCRSSPVLAVM